MSDGATHTEPRLRERLQLPAGYVARAYAGPADHPTIVAVLGAHRASQGEAEMPTLEDIDQSYANLYNCDPDRDIAIIEFEGEPVAYGRTVYEDHDLSDGGTRRDLIVFAPRLPEHAESLFDVFANALEAHLAPQATASQNRFRAYASHPGPGSAPTGEAAWLEARGYVATEWGATLVRPHLDDVDELGALPLPDGVDVRPVQPDQLRTIVGEYLECFRDEWDFHEPQEQDYRWILDSPHRDESLWQVAWHGDQVVGQVKPFINHEENAARGYLRGYTEYIGTHVDWRNRGIARALLGRALVAIRDRGMTEAALGVDTNNPGGAFQLYTSMGFELVSYDVVYTKPVP